MKIMIVSDLHGSAYYTRLLLAKMDEVGADMLALLGDIYNHGPRNPLPQEYAPLAVAEMLNGVKDKLLVIEGNCDSEVDRMISEFHFVSQACLVLGGHKLYLTHGHVYHACNLPCIQAGDTLVLGHYHVVKCQDVNGVHVLNPGSVSLPKDGHRAFILADENGAEILDLDGSLLVKMSF